MSDKTELFEYAPIPRAMAVMAIPTIFSQLVPLIGYNYAAKNFSRRSAAARSPSFWRRPGSWCQFIADIFTVILTYAVYWKLYKKPRGKALA